jgi:voltage-gated potassium channel Kch
MDHLNRYVYRYLSLVVVVILVVGTFFYHAVEKFTWVNAVYFCVVTLATVGYGDIVPKTDAGKIFTTVYIIIGVGVITTFFAATIRRRGETVRERYDSRKPL